MINGQYCNLFIGLGGSFLSSLECCGRELKNQNRRKFRQSSRKLKDAMKRLEKFYMGPQQKQCGGLFIPYIKIWNTYYLIKSSICGNTLGWNGFRCEIPIQNSSTKKASQRKQKNIVRSLEDENGQWCSRMEDFIAIINRYFSKTFSSFHPILRFQIVCKMLWSQELQIL